MPRFRQFKPKSKGLRISNLMVDQKDQPIRLNLPLVYDVGQAGYRNGQFVYSEDYYLKLQVIEGKAKSGDATKFVIERESQVDLKLNSLLPDSSNFFSPENKTGNWINQ